MSFVTWEFLLFFCAVVPFTFVVPRRIKLSYLLGVSLLFYFLGNGKYVLFLILSILFDYFVGKALSQSSDTRHRKIYLGLSLAFNLGFLIFFRYIATDTFGLLPPLGLSFYTFTKIGYVVDIYQQRIEPEQKVAPFAATIAFFPNITAGPIERVEHLRPQLDLAGRFDEQRTVEGLRLILWGVFKKVVIANQLALVVDVVYAQPQVFQGSALIIATLFFAFQIYADFSGYTDIAIGIARILGVELFENFRQPYLSVSVLEFWRRWHMSLTNWIRAYLFFPFSRKMLKKTERRHGRLIETSAYLIVMSIVGLWHGTSMTFLVWGILHGIYMSVESALPARFRRGRSRSAGWKHLANVVVTFGLVTWAWIFFRAETLTDAIYIATHLFSYGAGNLSEMEMLPAGVSGLALSGSLILLLIATDWLSEIGYSKRLLSSRMTVFRWGLYYLGLLAIWIVYFSDLYSGDFIYFQF